MIEINKGYNEDCLELLKRIPDGSLHIICIDPPYLYLKGQKLEREFDERLFFSECKRVLKTNGFIICFGRGTSFYRRNTIMDELGLFFKEEIVWDKRRGSIPGAPLMRRHETIAIYCKGKAPLNRVRVPYGEIKQHDIDAIKNDVRRIKGALNDTDRLNTFIRYLEDGHVDYAPKTYKTFFKNGFCERDRALALFKSVCDGMVEQSIISVVGEHYEGLHPTQKPVRLLERLIALVKPNMPNNEIIAADFFAGSFSFAEACINMGINWICSEIDKEYYDSGINRINTINNDSKQRLFA